MARKVILDVDTGSDDAVAIMAAALSPDIDLLAICTVWGNQAIENTTDKHAAPYRRAWHGHSCVQGLRYGHGEIPHAGLCGQQTTQTP